MQPIVCEGEWTESDVCDEFRLRLDTLDFPDFWLSCRFDAATGRVVVDGGRFSTSWNAEMGKVPHREFAVSTSGALATVSCLDARIEIPLPI